MTDEPLDAYVNRPLASWVVRAVIETKITPNQLTLISAFWGTVASFCFWWSPHTWMFGGVALFLCMVFDCSDGQLARARGGGNAIGRIVDGYADYWVAVALHFGILMHLGRTGVVLFGHTLTGIERVLFVLAAGVSMAVNSGRFDHYKHRYLEHTGQAREPETPEMYLAEAARTDSLFAKVLLRMFAWYVGLGSVSAAARAAAAKATASDPARVARFAAENGPLLRLWSLSGPTMHNAAICATALVSPFVPGAFTAYCIFAMVFVNAYCLALLFFQRRVVARESTHPGLTPAGDRSSV